MSVRSLTTNLSSLNAQRRLSEVSSSLGKTYDRLASGLRITKASDDAAGLAVATSLNLDNRIANQAIRNINDGISLLNIGAGALETLSSITIRISELSEQAANGVLGRTQRLALDGEALALQREYNRITATAEFNGRKIFDAENESVEIQNILTGGTGLQLSLGNALRREEFAGSFMAPVTTDAPSYRLGSVTQYDLNRDGNLDVVTFYDAVNRFGIHLGNGDGTFKPMITYVGSAGSNSFVGLSDFNNDRILDVTYSYQDNFHVSLGNSDGSFSLYSAVGTHGFTAPPVTSLVGDINGDGNNDLFFSRNSSVLISFGNGNGTFRAGVTILQSLPSNNYFGLSADLNGDGKSDLVVRETSSAQEMIVLLQNANGSFQAAQSRIYTWITRAEDINEDGKLDLVFNSFQYLPGNGDGTFKSQVSNSPYGGNFRDFQLFNADSDRNLDVIIANNSGIINVALGNGDGSFRGFVSQDAYSNFSGSIGDFNGDDVPDVLYGFVAGGFAVSLANTNSVATLESPDLRTKEVALATLEQMKVARDRITAELGNIGAFMSRLDISRSTLQVLGENLSSAASQILDADVAKESAELVRKQILQQSAQAVLVQSNQLPQLALRLIQGGA